jgi:MFS family permease
MGFSGSRIPFPLLIITDLAFLCIGLHQFIPSILYNELSGILRSTDFIFGVFGSVFYLSSAFGLIVTHYLSRCFSDGFLLGVNMFFLLAGTVLFSLKTSPALVYVARVLAGLSSSAILPLLARLTSRSATHRSSVVTQVIALVFHGLGALIAQIGISSVIDRSISWKAFFIGLSAVSGVVAVLTFFIFSCSRFAEAPESLSTAIGAGILESSYDRRILTFRQFAAVIVRVALPTAVLFNFESNWAGWYLTERFSSAPLDSGFLQSVLTFGFFLGWFTAARFGERCVGKWVNAVSDGLALLAIWIMAVVPAEINESVILALFFLFAAVVGWNGPITVWSIDEERRRNGKALTVALLVLNIVVAILGIGGGSILKAFDGDLFEKQFGLAVGLPSAVCLLISGVSVCLYPSASVTEID